MIEDLFIARLGLGKQINLCNLDFPWFCAKSFSRKSWVCKTNFDCKFFFDGGWGLGGGWSSLYQNAFK